MVYAMFYMIYGQHKTERCTFNFIFVCHYIDLPFEKHNINRAITYHVIIYFSIYIEIMQRNAYQDVHVLDIDISYIVITISQYIL